MRRYDIINSLLGARRPATYLEIGLARGENWFRVCAERKIGVEPRDVFTAAKVSWPRKILFRSGRWRGDRIYALTSDEFFERVAPDVFAERLIDVAFIDGWHSYTQSLQDVEHCVHYLAERGVVVLHDCNPTSAAATVPTPAKALALSGGKGGWNGDVWKTIVHVRSLRDDLDTCVLDCDEGLGIVRRGRIQRPLRYRRSDIERMTYADLAADRARLLNLQPAMPDVLRDLVRTR